MQVKKFLGENTVSVMALIRKEFGENAIILQTNKVKTGGFLGFFQKEEVEILAALDNEGVLDRKNKKESKDRGRIENNLSKTTQRKSQAKFDNQSIVSNSKSDMGFKYHIDAMNDRIKNRREKEADVSYQDDMDKLSVRTDSSFEDEAKEVKKDIDEIKTAVRELKKKINDTFKTPQEEEDIAREEENISKLRKLGISYEVSKEIVVNLKKRGKNFRYDDLKNEVLDMFADYIRVDFSKRHKYYVFIGSTGVGKTTTLAKIASKETIENKKRIGFLTLDTYRISAVEQLKTYAEILSSPIEVAYEIQDLSFAIDRLSNRDMVFIDTAGRSHNNKSQIEDLKKVLTNIEDKKVFLVLSANTSIDDIYDIVDTYSFVDDYEIIVTKTDETIRMGNILDIIKKTGKNISYITFGQNVPDDIEKFNMGKYVSELIREI